MTWFVWGVIFAAAIAGLLFGYDTGVISGTLVVIGGDLGPAVLSNGQKVRPANPSLCVLPFDSFCSPQRLTIPLCRSRRNSSLRPLLSEPFSEDSLPVSDRT